MSISRCFYRYKIDRIRVSDWFYKVFSYQATICRPRALPRNPIYSANLEPDFATSTFLLHLHRATKTIFSLIFEQTTLNFQKKNLKK